MEISRSTIGVGSGMMSRPMMQTTRKASTRSPNLEKTFEKFVSLLVISFSTVHSWFFIHHCYVSSSAIL